MEESKSSRLWVDVRAPAEYEAMQGILLRWPSLYPPCWHTFRDVIDALDPDEEIYVCVRDSLWQLTAALYLELSGIEGWERIRFLRVATDDIWVRDFGPVIVYNNKGKPVRYVIDTEYAPPFRARHEYDDNFTAAMSLVFGFEYFKLDIQSEGGNLVWNRNGLCVLTSSIFDRNPGLTEEMVARLFERNFGCTQCVILDKMEGEWTGHIDVFAKFLSDSVVLVGKLPRNDRNYRALEDAVLAFKRAGESAGTPFEVIRVTFPPAYKIMGFVPVYRSYTNSLILNDKVLVPLYGAEEDSAAMKVYQEAMPGHRVIGIDCRELVGGGGAIHSITREIPISKVSEYWP
jgi:agmatine deiminase